MEEIGQYRLEHPIDDITSALVNAEIESEKLTHQELASFFVLLLTAGNETTRTALGHALVVLDEHPEQRARWWRTSKDWRPPRRMRSCAGPRRSSGCVAH